MEFSEVVRRRKMVRSFTDEAIPAEAIEAMLSNAVRAPSAGFSQGWAFLVLDRPDDVASFWRVTTPPERAGDSSAWLRGMRTAPAIIVPMASESIYRDRYEERDKGATPRDQQQWAAPYWHIDTGMASLLILQTAVDAGLGACFFGMPKTQHEAFRSAFGAPATFEPIGAIAVGHPALDDRLGLSARTRKRRPDAEVVHRGRW
ncbi:nitroreductase family protein [Occultella aeris]|uniref:Coenzyme F420:L-glutamate ligase n=1 Tax=Occultella aeris TaxID=2761496 RepID=A0A7M4DT87_9MICO|nr:nitroreductase family protein [Occultella aeris]VZO40681.1 Coenzyme F420:L-glutamate ligase [Occultella aeris]